ncbi:RICIN domain-containing protein [Actinoplanes sp. NBRC 101535]|uniref:RICIN domain-containing protein n=1 Tax=Actinoplanes sp. NBRC 101535 TaxID=3032196 RepID=UPI0024A18C85|nr:RICIN domain-containing protein [Actinoplanes sp. NBRC 101535]GLY04462.1 hypothetical protein Acsp01_48410 [Actinoplanes sp. NBRC 101535]
MRRPTIALAPVVAIGAALLTTPAAALASSAPAAAAAADYWVTVKNWRSVKCLEQSAGTPDLTVAACTGDDSQQWAYTFIDVNSAIATVKNKKSGQCLDQIWADGVETTAVEAAACTGGLSQQWQVFAAEYQVTGYFLTNRSSGKDLQQTYVNNVQTPDVSVVQYSSIGDYRNLIWRR